MKYLFLLIFFFSIDTFSQSKLDDFLNSYPEMEKEQSQELYSSDDVGIMKESKNIGNGNKDNLVLVEPRNIVPSDLKGTLKMLPYRERRRPWGRIIGVSYSEFQPKDYKLDQLPAKYEEYYEKPELGLLQLETVIKKNLDLFSMGLYLSAGYFQAETEKDGVKSSLGIIPIKIGLYFSLDTLFREPWVVPFAHVGMYSTIFKEKTNGSTFDGTTLLAFYISSGLLFQLDWIDDLTARDAYTAGSIENTFLYLSYNYQSESVQDKDPKFNSSYASAGIKVEF